MTQAEFADKVGVNKATVRNWENGDNYPTLSMAVNLANVLGVSLDHLAGRS